MYLTVPSIQFEQQYLEALKEAENEINDTVLTKPAENQSFEDFVKQLNNQAKGLDLPSGYVPATTLWLIDNGEFIGRVQIRHELTDFLFREGGHIGYYIRLSKRGKKYGKKILELSLPEAKKIGLKRVLMTCDEDNIASKKIIEANGGVFENMTNKEAGKPRKLRYWIKIG